MRLGSAATCLLLASLICLPVAAAQAPPLPPAPEPGEALALACATVGGPAPDVRDALPVCPREEPAAPAAPSEAEPAAPAPAAPPAPQDVGQLADEIVEDARRIPEEPEEAPDRLQAIVATVVQYVRDLVGLPKAGFERALEGIDLARGAVADAARGVAETAADAAQRASKGVGDAARAAGAALADVARQVQELLQRGPDDAPGRVPAEARGPVRDAAGAADGLLELAPGEVRQVLAEG